MPNSIFASGFRTKILYPILFYLSIAPYSPLISHLRNSIIVILSEVSVSHGGSCEDDSRGHNAPCSLVEIHQVSYMFTSSSRPLGSQCNIPEGSHLHPNNIWWRVQLTQFHPCACHLGSSILLNILFLSTCYLWRSLKSWDLSFTLMKNKKQVMILYSLQVIIRKQESKWFESCTIFWRR